MKKVFIVTEIGPDGRLYTMDVFGNEKEANAYRQQKAKVYEPSSDSYPDIFPTVEIFEKEVK